MILKALVEASLIGPIWKGSDFYTIIIRVFLQLPGRYLWMPFFTTSRTDVRVQVSRGLAWKCTCSYILCGQETSIDLHILKSTSSFNLTRSCSGCDWAYKDEHPKTYSRWKRFGIQDQIFVGWKPGMSGLNVFGHTSETFLLKVEYILNL